MIGIRQKLILGFGGLLVIVVVIGVLTMSQIEDLGLAIDVILRENYRSVVACQNMKESLERIDSGVLFTFLGERAEGERYIAVNTAAFQAALAVELGNITVPGEQEKAVHLQTASARYTTILPEVTDPARPLAARQATYFSTLLPVFQQIKGLAQDILEMNQANMSEANDLARRQAASAHWRMSIAILSCAVIAVVFSLLVHRWIWEPIHRLTESAEEIRRGNLDLVLPADSHDEIGRLSEAFNAMAEALRQTRRSERMDLMRTRRATEEIFKVLPTAIAVLDLDGRVEVATETADRHFGLKPGVLVKDLGCDWLNRLVQRAGAEGRIVEYDADGGFVQQFADNQEYFFQPVAVPIPVAPNQGEPSGTAVILKDVTQVHEQQALKHSVVSTVSHQLRTPLTSLRMAIYLLLEERLGALNAKQTELLIAARDDSERLVGTLDNLLDLNRIESGKTLLNPQPASPHALVHDAVEPFLVDGRDRGVALVNAVAADLPEVLADSTRINHVFANLLSNALRFTSPGGEVVLRAEAEPGAVRFSVRDTGEGIPAEHLHRLFDPFYRVPGQQQQSGVGLGLAIVKQIVAAHGGEVGVASEPGRGSDFWFTLPRVERDDLPGA